MSEAVHKQTKIYKIVGAVLIAGTIITVLAANIRLGIILGIAVAIMIAVIKGSLVAGYFMHLFAERKMIYWVLALTAVFVAALVALIMFAYEDQQGRHHGIFVVPQQHAQPHSAGTDKEAGHVP